AGTMLPAEGLSPYGSRGRSYTRAEPTPNSPAYTPGTYVWPGSRPRNSSAGHTYRTDQPVRGLRRACPARFGVVQTTESEVGQGLVKAAMADQEAVHEPSTDAALLADGYATITPLRPIYEATEIPLPAVRAERLA